MSSRNKYDPQKGLKLLTILASVLLILGILLYIYNPTDTNVQMFMVGLYDQLFFGGLNED